MFKKIILAALVVASAVFAEVNVGGRAAVNFGTLWGASNDTEWGVGFNAGVNLKVGINGMLSFVPGLEIDLRRVTGEEEYREYYSSITIEESLNMWYLDIPLALRVNVNPQFFIDGGIYVGFNLSTEMTAEVAGISRSEDVGENMESVDFGLIVGLGFNVVPNLDVNFRLALGFTEMAKDADGSKNMRLQLGATYWFM